MTTMTAAPTVSRNRGFGPAAPWGKRRSRSFINADLLDARIGRVLADWEDTKPVDKPSVEEAQTVHVVREYPHTAVDAVEFIRDVLGVTQDAVLAAVSIAERTYFGWKSRPGTRPRVSTQGKLWLMVEALHGLEPLRPSLAAWFQATPEAQRAFAAGDVSRFQLLELQDSTFDRPDLVPDARLFGDRTDPAGADSGDSEPFVLAKPTHRVRTTPKAVVPPRGASIE